jgi:hypothetical protein
VSLHSATVVWNVQKQANREATTSAVTGIVQVPYAPMGVWDAMSWGHLLQVHLKEATPAFASWVWYESWFLLLTRGNRWDNGTMAVVLDPWVDPALVDVRSRTFALFVNWLLTLVCGGMVGGSPWQLERPEYVSFLVFFSLF